MTNNMTSKKYADKAREMVSLEELLEHMSKSGKNRSDNTPLQRSEQMGNLIVEQSVCGFYTACLEARGVTGSEANCVQDWIADCIEVTLGEKDTRHLSMRELANKIADAVNGEAVSMEDRWALYELCFLLTAQIGIEEKDHIKWSEQCARRGTPEEREPKSLYRRAFSQLVARDFQPRKKERKTSLLTLEQLLRSMSDTASDGQHPFLNKSMEYFTRCCIVARNQNGPSDERDVLNCMMEDHRFMEAARVYGGREWMGTEHLLDFARSITIEYLYRAEGQTLPRHEMLQAYELCYEFINLMADEEHCRGHRSLMQVENLPAHYDIDLLQEAQLEADMEAATAFEEHEKQRRNAN